MKKTTVFVIETGEPSLDDCMARMNEQTQRNLIIKKISNVFPMWKAFQCMLDECETDLFVQVDADMLLEPFAIKTLYERINSQPASTAISVGWLWDNDVERQILGVKIYNHNICVNFPYTDSLSCEMTQVESMKKHGYTVDVMDMPAEQDECLGVHFPSQNPEMAFRRWERNMVKMRKLKWMDWLKIYPQRLFQKMLANPSDEIARAKLFGVMSGLSLNDISNSEADYSKTNDSFSRYSEFFGVLSFGVDAYQSSLTTKKQALPASSNPNTKIKKRWLDVNGTSILENQVILYFSNAYKENKYLAICDFDIALDEIEHTIKLKIELAESDTREAGGSGLSFVSSRDIAKIINKGHPNFLSNIALRESDSDIADTHFWTHLDSTYMIINHLSNGSKLTYKDSVKLKNTLLFAIDVYGWAFDNISTQVLRDTQYSSRLFKVEYHFLHFIMRCIDLEANIMCFWWKSVPLIKEASPRSRIATLLFDHYSWTEDESELSEILNESIAIGVGNNQLEQEVRHLTSNQNVFTIKDGVDFELFPLSNEHHEPFTFGWVGNSSIQRLGGYDGKDLKGVGIIQAAARKVNARLHILDVTKQPKVPQHQMFEEFYSKIDCYICASESEGTPNTVFESLACGLPVITTRVGNVKDVIIEGYNGFLVDRDEASLVRAIETVLKNKERFKRNRASIRESVKHFSWRLKTLNWEVFLDFVFDQL